jgi:hypothetical protein
MEKGRRDTKNPKGIETERKTKRTNTSSVNPGKRGNTTYNKIATKAGERQHTHFHHIGLGFFIVIPPLSLYLYFSITLKGKAIVKFL